MRDKPLICGPNTAQWAKCTFPGVRRPRRLRMSARLADRASQTHGVGDTRFCPQASQLSASPRDLLVISGVVAALFHPWASGGWFDPLWNVCVSQNQDSMLPLFSSHEGPLNIEGMERGILPPQSKFLQE